MRGLLAQHHAAEGDEDFVERTLARMAEAVCVDELTEGMVVAVLISREREIRAPIPEASGERSST